MATNIRGDITYLIGANNTGFSRAVDDTRDQLRALFSEARAGERANVLGSIFAKGAAGAVGAIASIGAATTALADNYRETAILAEQTGLTVQAFRSLDLAAQQYGLTGEQVADITKDIKDRAQEFARDGTGQFEDLRNELGLTKDEGRELAAQMVEMSGDKAIGLMINRMEDLGLSGNQMTQVLESMANNLSRIYPLYKDNASELERLSAAARSVQLPDSEGQEKAFRELSESVDLLGIAITSWLEGSGAPLVKFFSDAAKASAYFFASINEGTEDNLASDLVNVNDKIKDLRKELETAPENVLLQSARQLESSPVRTKEQIQKLLDNLISEREALTKALNEARGLTLPKATTETTNGKKPEKPETPTTSQVDKEAAKKALDALTKSAQTEQQKLDQRRKQFDEFYKKGLLNESQYTKAKQALAVQQKEINEDTAKQEDQALKAKSGARGQLALLTEQTTKEKQEYNKRLDEFKGFLAKKYISQEEFNSAEKALNADLIEAENQSALAAMNDIHAKRMQQLEAERAALEEFGGLTANLYLSISESMVSVSDVMQNSLNTAIDGVSESIGNAIVNGDNLGDSLVSVAKNIAAAFVSSLVKIGIQETILAGLRATAAGTAAAGYVAEVTGQSTAAVSLASLNAFASTAAIPIVGPALAPAAAASAGALASPFAAAAIAAASSTLASSAVRGKKATGGHISANTAAPYLVGEMGPELFVPSSAGLVVPNNQLGGGGTTNVNISAVDAAGVEQLLLENTDLILGLVREA